jgi:LysM repeat protein
VLRKHGVMRAVFVLVVVVVIVLGPAGVATGARPAKIRYVVAPGDTLTGIAERYHIPIPRLARANGVDWRSPLLIGTKLQIPRTSTSARPSPSGWSETYLVRAGDTLSAIADRYDVPLSKFAEMNGIDWRVPLLIGTKLQIPGAPAAPRAKPSGWPGTYVVQLGDSLSGIADRYGVSLSVLAYTNGIDPAGVLMAGRKLRVPAPSSPQGTTITVMTGDTLSGIAAHYGLSLTSLVGANRIDVKAPLLVGQQLVIPSGAGLSSPLIALTRSQADPYPHGSAGLDISYPSCGRTPEVGGFTVVGLNAGRPFTTNPCFATEYAAAAEQGLPSVYVNSAYGRSMLGQITSDCADSADTLGLGWRQDRAYALGCSEAEAATSALAGTRVAAIWVDVESANTWSTDPQLNRATLEGFLVTLISRQQASVGVYASPIPWQDITSGWHLSSLPEWIAMGPPGFPGCSAPFATGTVWLSQSTPDQGLHDNDTAC